jgi:hypothetical protein
MYFGRRVRPTLGGQKGGGVADRAPRPALPPHDLIILGYLKFYD